MIVFVEWRIIVSKVAIVTDSNSGITQAQAKELGVFVLPMPFTINDEAYFEDINLTIPEFYKMLEEDCQIFTSQPTPGSVMEIWDNILKEYDEVVHIPMSSGLSNSTQTAIMLAKEEDYEGKVFVVDNQRISVTLRESVLDAKKLAEAGKTGSEIKSILEEDKFNSSIYIMVDTLEYLKKGGRITTAAAALGSILRIKPVLTIQGEKLDSFAKARTASQGKTLMLNAIKNDIETRFGGVNENGDVWLYVVHSNDEESAMNLKAELEEFLPGYPIHVDHLSLSVSCHIGPGSLAIACAKKLNI